MVEGLSNIDTIVFDKTGTLTEAGASTTDFYPINKNNIKKTFPLVKSITWHSTHPLSRKITQYLDKYKIIEDVQELQEFPGEGMSGVVNNKIVKIGSEKFVSINSNDYDIKMSKVHISVENEYVGYFGIKGSYRTGFKSVLSKLSKDYDILLLSGDNDHEKEILSEYFEDKSKLFF